MPTPSRELLIVSPERWDELCFSVPAVRALAASGLGIGVLCQPHQKAFWQTLPELVVRSPEDLNDDWQVALLWETGELAKAVRKAGIHKRIGPAQGSKGKLAKHLTETLNEQAHPTQHRVQFYLTAVNEMGVPTAKPEFFAPAQDLDPTAANSILLAPDSDFGSSCEWPLEKWRALCESLLEGSSPPSLTCIQNGGTLAAALVSEFEGRIAPQPMDFKQPELGVFARHPLVLGADGSLPHLAAHLGATCITLFGPNDPQWKRPLGKRHRVLHRHVECAPCLMASCPLDLRCQTELEVDEVRKAVHAVSA